MPNRLANETSPYLLQHADNPVDWYPWGPEALARAREEDMPILLSVGYSACHWCHVMERESFESKRIAALMNESFVCIKVDREERPDIDSIYMSAVQAMTGQGGWPMTVFLTPEGEPFFGGTYFPPEDRGPLAGFPRVLEAVARAWVGDRSNLKLASARILQQMRQQSPGTRRLEPLTKDILYAAYRGIAGQFDDRYGGIGTQPKFPQPMAYELLLRHHLRTGDQDALDMVELTLDRMALGGIYDQVGGGFHRYSTDTFWLVPHFEKMLYDNALLVKLYLHAFQVTRKPLYRRVVEETLRYVLREMADEAGGFYSAQDADSEGVEGKFFLWRLDQVIAILGNGDGETVNRYFGVTPQGNFEGLNILNVSAEAVSAQERTGMSQPQFEAFMERAKARLLESRAQRVRPARDEKVLTAWNGMMLRAFAEASAVLGRGDYAAVAERNAAFILDRMREGTRLLRSYKDGQARLNGYLEDYAFLIDGLLALHEATFGARWLRSAIELGYAMVELFWDELAQQFYDTGTDHEELVVRPRDVTDNAVPSGSSMAADVLLRLAVITGDQALQRRAVSAMRAVQEPMARTPSAFSHWLCALDFYLSAPKEVAIIGERGRPETEALVAQVFSRYLPNRVLLGTGGEGDEMGELPLMAGRRAINGTATAYVCQNYACRMPVTEAAALAAQLEG